MTTVKPLFPSTCILCCTRANWKRKKKHIQRSQEERAKINDRFKGTGELQCTMNILTQVTMTIITNSSENSRCFFFVSRRRKRKREKEKKNKESIRASRLVYIFVFSPLQFLFTEGTARYNPEPLIHTFEMEYV